MKMNKSLVVALTMGMAASVFAEDRGAAQRQVKPVADNTERELDYNPIVVDENTMVAGAKSDRTNTREPDLELLRTQIEDLVNSELGVPSITEGTFSHSLKEVAREISEHFESMIVPMKEGSFSASSVSSMKGRDIVSVVPTTGGVLAVMDLGDGAVHLFAIVNDPTIDDTADFALHVAITGQGPEVRFIDEDLLARFVGMKRQNAELGVVNAPVDRGVQKLDKELLTEQLFALGDGKIEGAPFELLQEAAPEVYKFVRSMESSMGDEPLSTRVTSQLTDSSTEQGYLDVVPMRGGVLSVIDRGDGAVHLIVNAIDHETLNADEGGFALNLAITQDGVEIIQLDDDLLTQFVSG